jgi:phosphoribosylanthranilate isomerase
LSQLDWVVQDSLVQPKTKIIKNLPTQTEEDNSRNKSNRDDIRVKNFEETKLLNFYNFGGIRFQNIAANDAVISSKLNAMVEEGWELIFVNSGVESDAGEKDGQGIFITRYIFKRTKK